MKFLTNSKYYFFALLACCMLACSDDNDKNGDDDGDYTDSPLTPDENKAKIENIGQEFVAKIKAADHEVVVKSLNDLSEAMDGSNFDKLLPDYLQDDSEEHTYPINPALLAKAIENNDMNLLMRLSTESIDDDEYRMADFEGIYTYNGGSWSKADADANTKNKMELRMENTVVSMLCSNISEYTKVDGVIVEVPANITLTLTVNGKVEMTFVTETTLSKDMYNATINSTLTLNAYSWVITASANPDRVAATFKMVVKGEELINGTGEVTGNKLTDPDNIEDNELDIINNGTFEGKIMNIRLTGNGNIKAISEGLDKIDNTYPWESDYTEAADKKNAEAEMTLYNKHTEIQGFYIADKQKFADVKMGLYSEEGWRYNHTTQKSEPITEWDIQPILVFTDKSEMEFEKFFTETRFSTLITSVETLVNTYMHMIGKKDVDF